MMMKKWWNQVIITKTRSWMMKMLMEKWSTRSGGCPPTGLQKLSSLSGVWLLLRIGCNHHHLHHHPDHNRHSSFCDLSISHNFLTPQWLRSSLQQSNQACVYQVQSWRWDVYFTCNTCKTNKIVNIHFIFTQLPRGDRLSFGQSQE